MGLHRVGHDSSGLVVVVPDGSDGKESAYNAGDPGLIRG